MLAEEAFPCTLRNFPRFLGIASYFLKVGSQIELPRRRAGETLFHPDTMWQIPSELRLPEVDLQFDSDTGRVNVRVNERTSQRLI